MRQKYLDNYNVVSIKNLLLWVLIGFISAACAGSGRNSNSFGRTAAVSPTLAPVVTLASREAPISRQAIADMNALASQQGQGIYRIGASDLLEIKVFQADELSRQVRVDQRGNITLPLMGTIRVAGMSQGELEKRLADLMGANLLQNPQVSVFIKEFTAQRVTVEGEVQKQGVYPLTGQVSVLQAIALAGGLGEFAAADKVVLFRKHNNGVRNYSINLDAIRSGQAHDPLLQNDDRIVVQRLEEQRVTVDGEVVKPGVFPYKEQITIMQAIAMAQGLSNLAAPEKVVVFRRENGVEKAYSVNLTEIRQGKVQDPFVQSDDRIVVDRSNGRYWLKEMSPLVLPLNYLIGIF